MIKKTPLWKTVFRPVGLIWPVVVLALSGCAMVGPDFIPPEPPLAEEWIDPEDPNWAAPSEYHEDWWKVFEDPKLNLLVEETYSQNLNLQIAGLRILESRAQLGIAAGNIYPQQQQINASANTVGLGDNTANLPPGSDSSFKNYNVGAGAAWELDFWGKFRRGIEAADAAYFASIADYDNLMVTLTAETARVYILIRTLEERIRLAEENVAIQKRSLKIADSRFKGGLVTELDVQQARTLLANTQALIPLLQSEYERALHALAILLGIPPKTLFAEVDLSQEEARIPQAPSKVAVGIPADLLRRRPDIRQAELLAATQSALVGVAQADLYPHFTLFGTIGLHTSNSNITRNGGSNFSDLFDSSSLSYFAGPSLTWDVFNYGRIKNQVRVQDARLQQTIINYQNTVLLAAQEVEDAMSSFLRDKQQVAFRTEAVDASRRSVEISLLQYEEGIVDYQRVLETQRGLTNDQDRLADVQGSVALDLVQIYRALGGGWQVARENDFISSENREVLSERTDWGDLLEEPEQEQNMPEQDSGWRTPDW